MNKLKKLQLFAEEGSGAESNEAGASEQSNETKQGGEKKTGFDEFLQDKENQAEFDRRVNKAIQTALSNAEKKWQIKTDTKVSEAEKLAQMSREEKAEYKAAQFEKELNKLKREIALAEMGKEARKLLAAEEISLPDEIIGNLISEDAESTKASVEAFAKSYKEAVQEEVRKALRGEAPKAGGNASKMTKAQIMGVKDYQERQRLIAENIELFTGGKK